MTALCSLTATDIRDNGPGMPVIPCDEPAVAVITFACEHEHVDVQPACMGCSAEIQQCAGLLGCPRCEDSPVSPHECKATARIEWISGEVTYA